jgi:hypothetical protein
MQLRKYRLNGRHLKNGETNIQLSYYPLQPATIGTMDAAYFAGFWLRHQRIGTRFV